MRAISKASNDFFNRSPVSCNDYDVVTREIEHGLLKKPIERVVRAARGGQYSNEREYFERFFFLFFFFFTRFSSRFYPRFSLLCGCGRHTSTDIVLRIAHQRILGVGQVLEREIAARRRRQPYRKNTDKQDKDRYRRVVIFGLGGVHPPSSTIRGGPYRHRRYSQRKTDLCLCHCIEESSFGTGQSIESWKTDFSKRFLFFGYSCVFIRPIEC